MGDNSAASQSTVTKKTVQCEECGKSLCNKQSLTKHVLKIHRKIVETSRSPLVQSTSSVLTADLAPPTNPASPSLPGPSSAAPTTATTVAPTEAPAPATPATPTTPVSPTRTSPVTTAVPRTLSFSELSNEREFMEEAAKEMDLYEKLDKLTQEATNPDHNEESRLELKVKISEVTQMLQTKERQQTFMLEQLKKAYAQAQANKKCSDCPLRDEVEEDAKKAINEKEKQAKDANDKLKKLEKEHKKTMDQSTKDVKILQEAVGNLTKINNNLKVEIAKDKSYIKQLEEANAPEEDAENEVEEEQEEEAEVEVEVHADESAKRVNMNKGGADNRCEACDKLFKAAADLERHIRDRHEDNECPMCKKLFTSRKQAEDHICTDGEIIPQICDKSYCKKEFVSSAALNKHIKNNHFGHQKTVCTKCGEMLDKNIGLKKHLDTCGKNASDSAREERSREVCRHWRKGRCDRGSHCNFTHVGRQDSHQTKHQSTSKTLKPCQNGPGCSYLAKGRCSYGHHETNGHQARDQNRRPSLSRDKVQSSRGKGQEAFRMPCKFGRDCDRVINCPYIHSMEDFPQYQKSRGFKQTNRTRNHRN